MLRCDICGFEDSYAFRPDDGRTYCNRCFSKKLKDERLSFSESVATIWRRFFNKDFKEKKECATYSRSDILDLGE